MKFDKLEVIESLLNVRSKDRSIRRAETVEIEVEQSASSKKALELLLQGFDQASRYNIEAARRAFCEAMETARRDRDGFIEAAACLHRVQLMHTQNSPAGSQQSFLKDALEVLDFDIFAQESKLTESRAKPEDARPIILPRLALKELLQHTLAQYDLRQQSMGMADSLCYFEEHLSKGNFVSAESVARSAESNAEKSFGRDHWWHALSRLWLSRACRRQGKIAEADKLAASAEQALLEWTELPLDESIFKDEVRKCRKAANPVS
ncbi:MAG: hypothetical protein K2X27_22830 [Candidatus Obscuribacterales bacterium]|nr:hypothetical protein [Candidatus Obscuribacterales bacterium]